MMPSAMPPSSAARCAAASCSSASHCSHLWKSTRSASRRARVDDADDGSRAPSATADPAASRRARTTARTSPDRRPPARRSASTPPAARPTGAPRTRPRGPPAWPSRRRRGRSGPASRSGPPGSAAHSTSARSADGQVARLAHVLDADVDRVHEPAGRRQVRRRGHRRRRSAACRGLMSRKSAPSSRPASQPISARSRGHRHPTSDASAPSRAGHEPPRPVLAHRPRAARSCVGVTTSGLCASALGPLGDDLVPAERQVVGSVNVARPDQAPVDGPRVHGHVGLRHLSPTATGLGVQLDPHLDRVTVGDVHRRRGPGAPPGRRAPGAARAATACPRRARSPGRPARATTRRRPSAPSTPRRVAVQARRLRPWKSQWSGTTP